MAPTERGQLRLNDFSSEELHLIAAIEDLLDGVDTERAEAILDAVDGRLEV